MKKNALIILGIWTLVGCFGASTMAEANSWRKDPFLQLSRKMKKEDMGELYQQLNLSDRQKQGLEKNRKKNHQRIKQLRQRKRELKRQLTEELKKKKLDQKRITKIKAELNQVQAQLSDLRLEGIMGVREILTPEQYNQFLETTK